MFKGTAASPGIVLGKALVLEHNELVIEKKSISDVDKEIERLNDAVAISKAELEKVRDKAKVELGEEEAQIFESHLLVLEDPELLGSAIDKVKSENVNADFALNEIKEMFVGMFEAMDNEYMRERAADIKDVTNRILRHLLGVKIVDLAALEDEVVLVAHDLTPSDTAQLDRSLVVGFLTNIGGRTSHSAIMARSLEIPAVVACKTITEEVKDGDLIVLDGIEGTVMINPDETTVKEYETKRAEFIAYKEELKKLVNEKTITTDGHQVELVANIGSAKDLAGVKDNGGEGVVLFRTEFLYMESAELPTEEQQFEVYKEVLEGMEGKPVVVRTLDIGGDKEIEAIDLPKEMNPFLGVRAIRLCFQREDIFRTQLRALLRASVYGDLRIMFPMIATLQEFRKAKGILMEEKEKLVAEGVKVSDTLQVGIMIEIPAAAVLAHKFAKEVDFFSVGTNDLVQYTFAADRMSSGVSYLYQPFNPSILNLLKHVIDSAHAEGKWAGMCGEMAGEAIAAPLLLGLGLDEFSMSATSILAQRKLIKSVSKADMEALVEKALDCATSEEVVELVKSTVKM